MWVERKGGREGEVNDEREHGERKRGEEGRKEEEEELRGEDRGGTRVV